MLTQKNAVLIGGIVACIIVSCICQKRAEKEYKEINRALDESIDGFMQIVRADMQHKAEQSFNEYHL